MTEIRIVARCAWILASALACAGASAQSAPEPAPATSAADRAQKEADRPLYWIRVLAEKPAAKPPAAKPAAPATTATAPPARPVMVASDARPADHARMTPAAAPSTRDTAASTASSADAVNATRGSVVRPESMTAAVSRETVDTAAGGLMPRGLDTGIEMPVAPAAPDVTPVEVELPDPGLVMTKSADPKFPMTTMRRLRQGEVEVRFEVGADGQVDIVSVVKSTNQALNSAALEAVRQWQFKPTPKGHTAVVDLAFNLDS